MSDITTAAAKDKLQSIHNTLRLDYGSFSDEFPEQLMAVRFLTGDEKVLEIGGNIGRNTLVISSILTHNNFVSMESHPHIAKQLEHNRNINGKTFHIENAALSKRKLVQRGWNTVISDVVLDGYTDVRTITYDELMAKYGIAFNTLVLDCEGAFYYILQDMPEILSNIKLIIMENDYNDVFKKEYIDRVLKSSGFSVVYTEKGGWGPCFKNFFEVWKKE